MRSMCYICLLIGLVLGADDPPKKAAKDDPGPLQGGWSMVQMMVSGEEIPADQVKTGELVVLDDEYRPVLGTSTETATTKVDASKSPKEIDFTYTTGFQKGKTVKGIYKVEGDKLTICRAQSPDQQRPNAFAAPAGSGLVLVVWKKSDTVGGTKLKATLAELKKFEGTWKFVSVEVEGDEVPEERFADDRLVIKGRQFRSSAGGKTNHGVFKIDPTAKPKTIDLTFTDGPGKDQTQKGIYELEGDTQKICFSLPGRPRPTEFVSKADSRLMIQVLEREKRTAPAGK
jgi:uncharacterized protein (TIGR03067 family)